MPATAPLAPQYDYLANVLTAADKVSAAALTGSQTNIVAALNSLISDLSVAIRSDNQLMDQIVHLWTLGPDVLGVIGSAAGWQPKTSAQAATTAALPTNTYAAGVLTATVNGALPAQDGVALVAGQSLLVQNEVAGANNGIYTVTQVGSGGTPWILTRRADASTAALLGYAFLYVSSGAINGGINFLCTVSVGNLVLGTTPITFLPFGRAQGTSAVLTLAAGGTGASTAAGARANIGSTAVGDALFIAASAVAARATIGIPAVIDPLVSAASLGAARTAIGDVPGQVSTIAALKALATTDLAGGQVVRGYYAAGDGGGGVYFWSAADARADNGGTIIQPNSGGVGRWNLIVQGSVSLLQFGAKADGATDCAPALQASVNAGYPVYIPNAGTGFNYIGTGPCVCPARTYVFGTAARSPMKRSGTYSMFYLAGNDITIENLHLDCTSATAGSYDITIGTGFTSMERLIIRNIKTFNSPGFLTDENHVSNIYNNLTVALVYNSIHRGRGYYLRNAFAFLKFNDVLVDYTLNGLAQNFTAYEIVNNQGCFLTDVEVTGSIGIIAGTTTAQKGFVFTNSLAVYLRRTFADTLGGAGFTFTGCGFVRIDHATASSCDGIGWLFDSTVRVVGSNVYVGGRLGIGSPTANVDGIVFQNACQYVIMTAVEAYNCTGRGVFNNGCANITFSGGMIHGNTGRGMQTAGAGSVTLWSGITFQGNTAGNYITVNATDLVQGCQLSAGGASTTAGPQTL